MSDELTNEPDVMQEIDADLPIMFFSMLPHMAEDELDPFQGRLYWHYVRVCGEITKKVGKCEESERTTAGKCKMSRMNMRRARQELAELGYIRLKEPASPNKPYRITIANRWNENFLRYAESYGLNLDHAAKSGLKIDQSGLNLDPKNKENNQGIQKTSSAGAEGGGPSGKVRLPSAPVDGSPLTQDLGEYRKLEEVIRDTFSPGKNWISEPSRKKLQNTVSRHLANGKEEILTAPVDLYDENPTFVKFVQRQLDFWKKREELEAKSKKYAAINSILDYFGDYGWVKYEDSVLKSGRGPEMPKNAGVKVVVTDDVIPDQDWDPL